MSPDPVPPMRPLDPIAGRWRTTGRTLPGVAPSFEITGTDTYEWVAGGHVLLHRVDVRMGDQAMDVIEVIAGRNEVTGTWPMHSWGDGGEQVLMHASLEPDGALRFTGDTERTRLVVSPDGGSMHADWERTDDGETWTPWLTMDFTRA